MTHQETLASVQAKIAETEALLKTLRKQAQKIEGLNAVTERDTKLSSFNDFPRKQPLLLSLEINASRLDGMTTEFYDDITVGHLVRMIPQEIFKHMNVTKDMMVELREWMFRHNVSFIDEGQMIYSTPALTEPLSTFDQLWDGWMGTQSVKTLNETIMRMAAKKGKCLGQEKSRKEFTVGDMLQLDLADFQEESGFDYYLMTQMKRCIHARGLRFKFYDE